MGSGRGAMGCGASIASIADAAVSLPATDAENERSKTTQNASKGTEGAAALQRGELGRDAVLDLADGERPPLPELSEIEATKLVGGSFLSG